MLRLQAIFHDGSIGMGSLMDDPSEAEEMRARSAKAKYRDLGLGATDATVGRAIPTVLLYAAGGPALARAPGRKCFSGLIRLGRLGKVS
jgi:hypothetical protein